VFIQRVRLAKLAIDHRIAAIIGFDEAAEAGVLISYGERLMDHTLRLPRYVDRILRGAKPADLPVEQPDRFYLVINLKTAKALGLTIPPSVLARADHIIE
jgi:ABC-type uncharacterized transport system substrate-binding protein